jgi:hypothetical protein
MSQKFLAKNKNNIQGVAGQIKPEDRKSIDEVLRSKSMQITNGDIDVQHLVSDMKRLFLDEQCAFDAKMIVYAFELNEHIINYSLTGSTYENQESGIVRYIQTAAQSDADNLMNSLTNSWGLDKKGIKLKASYDHLPIMQSTMTSKITNFTNFQTGLKSAIEIQTIDLKTAQEMTENMRKRLML